jgi:hypothetical protein
MDLAIRDLTVDELEHVAGGDAPNGAGCHDSDADGPTGNCVTVFRTGNGVPALTITRPCNCWW